MFKTILAATDLTEASAPALTVARDLAGRFGAELTLLFVSAPPYQPPQWSTGVAEDQSLFLQAAQRERESAERELQSRLAGLVEVSPSIRAQAVVVSGFVPDAVLAEAERRKADLIVLGTHGRKGLSRLFLGSTAERVVRGASCPVLTVRAPES